MSIFIDDSDAGYDWFTPRCYWQPLGDALGGFDLDPACPERPFPTAEAAFTPAEDGLAREWFGHVWLNPPYGREASPKWAEKAAQEFDAGRVDSITALVMGSTDADWWQLYADRADLLTTTDHRVDFGGEHKASFDVTWLSLFQDDVPEEYRTVLDTLGRGRDWRTRIWE